MPMTARMLRDLSGKEPDRSLAVSEVVSRGAAIHAARLAAHLEKDGGAVPDALRQIVQVNVSAHSLGIEVRKGDDERLNDVLIRRNTSLPSVARRVYATVIANQQRVRVRVLQGDTPHAAACNPLGECWIDGLPVGLPKGSPIEVCCALNDESVVQVTARDLTCGQFVRATLNLHSGLSPDEIAREEAWVSALRVV